MSVFSIGESNSILTTLYNQSVQNEKSPEEHFEAIDTDESSTISATELVTLTDEISTDFGVTVDAEEAVETYDSDSDGELSQSELDTMMTELMQQFGPGNTSENMDSNLMQALSSYTAQSESSDISSFLQQLGTMSIPPSTTASSTEEFDALDTDEDGNLSAEELQTLTDEISEISGTTIDAEESVATYDEDGDGVLSEDEMNSFMADLYETLGPPPETEQPAETLADTFTSYLENADEETLSGLIEVISQYVTSTSSSSGVDLQA